MTRLTLLDMGGLAGPKPPLIKPAPVGRGALCKPQPVC